MYQYYLFYKPFQVLCQFSPEPGKRTLADYFTGIHKDVYPVGRLDYDSEGLLVLTNDKHLTHRLLSPEYGHKRTYWVQVEGTATPEANSKLCGGVDINIDGKMYRTRKALAEIFAAPPAVPERTPPIRYRKNVPDSWLSLTLTEGKNRQVRKMTAAVGFPTLRLIRYAIGKYSVDGMAPGDIRQLRPNETELLFEKMEV